MTIWSSTFSRWSCPRCKLFCEDRIQNLPKIDARLSTWLADGDAVIGTINASLRSNCVSPTMIRRPLITSWLMVKTGKQDSLSYWPEDRPPSMGIEWVHAMRPKYVICFFEGLIRCLFSNLYHLSSNKTNGKDCRRDTGRNYGIQPAGFKFSAACCGIKIKTSRKPKS